MPLIEIKGLRFGYKDGKTSLEALKGFDLDIQEGEFICLIGPSGCGKSTLLRMLAGLERPDSGELRIGGRPVEGPGPDRMIVFQNYALFPWLSAEKNVSFALRRGRGLGKKEANALAQSYLERLGMAQGAKLYPFQLSGGMRQRVAIARALAMDPEILLLDEPFGALDAKIRREIQELLLSLWQQDGEKRKTVVFVTHDVSEAVLLADRVVFAEDGRVKAELAIALPRPREKAADSREYRELMSLFQEASP